MTDITIVNVALPDIGHEFHSSLSGLQWIIDAYALVLAAGLLTAGSLADLFGRRILYAAGTALFTLGSLLCGLATDPVFLVVARIVQGLGGTVVYATSLALISHAFRGEDPKARGTAFGIYGAVLGIGAALGPVVGGFLVSLPRRKRHRRKASNQERTVDKSTSFIPKKGKQVHHEHHQHHRAGKHGSPHRRQGRRGRQRGLMTLS